jgi:D-alanyl-D-alanine carboxypeptidase/D-alanyl-D-alanine-endopeptidase (penicillin-binding protein 4)
VTPPLKTMHHPITSALRPPRSIHRSPIRAAALAFLLLTGAAPPGWPSDALRADLDAATAPLRQRALFGAKVVSLDRGETLWEQNAAVCVVPASNQKLLTSAAALDRLGTDYRFRTEVLTLGRLQADGTLAGDLILRGGGDPLLATADLEALAAAVRRAGVRRVGGLLRADDTRYAREPLGVGWSWENEPYAFSAQASALSLDGNAVEIEVSPGARAGLPARLRVTPSSGALKVRAACRTLPAGAAAEVDVTRERGRNEVTVRGGVPLGASLLTRRVTMETPALHAAAVWRKLLARQGVSIVGETRLLGTPAAARLLAAHDSPPSRGSSRG